jgi:hypothetical protein
LRRKGRPDGRRDRVLNSTADRRSESQVGSNRPLKRRFLVLYDYETGGAWAYLLAESEEQIKERFPDLQIVATRPEWMTDQLDSDLQTSKQIDIDDTDNPFLAALNRKLQDP